MIIYKKDSKGKIRILDIEAVDENLVQKSGLIDGKQVEHIKNCKPKNVGKSNETSSEQQAEIEEKALIIKKLREWYFLTREEAESEIVVMPMLAHSYDKYKDKIDWDNCYVQPKLDGMRCLAVIKNGEATLLSRKWVKIETMNHIVENLLSLTNGEDDIILDWELYLHWESFQENMKLIKKYRKWFSENVKYCIYDMVEKLPFHQRGVRRYRDVMRAPCIEEVSTYKIKNEEELKKWHANFIASGYEWTMIRHWIKGYKMNGRDSQLLKYKDFLDETFKIVGVVAMEVYEDQWILVCEREDWARFMATPKMSHKDRRDLLSNSEEYIWQTAEVRFFEYTDDGFPRFPICVGFRLDK